MALTRSAACAVLKQLAEMHDDLALLVIEKLGPAERRCLHRMCSTLRRLVNISVTSAVVNYLNFRGLDGVCCAFPHLHCLTIKLPRRKGGAALVEKLRLQLAALALHGQLGGRQLGQLRAVRFTIDPVDAGSEKLAGKLFNLAAAVPQLQLLALLVDGRGAQHMQQLAPRPAGAPADGLKQLTLGALTVPLRVALPVAHLRQLQSLELLHCNDSYYVEAYPPLSQLRELTQLKLRRYTEEVLPRLGLLEVLPHLQDLTLEAHIGTLAYPAIAGLQNLTRLRLCSVADDNNTLRCVDVYPGTFGQLTALRRLQSLQMHGSAVAAEAASVLALPLLTSLACTLLRTVSDDAAPEPPSPSRIALGCCVRELKLASVARPGWGGRCQAGLALLHPAEEIVDLRTAGSATAADVAALAALSRLQWLHVQRLDASVTDAGFARAFRALTSLRSLDIGDMGPLGDTGLSALTALTGLTSLSLAYSDMVTDAGVSALACLQKLSVLRWTKFELVTHAGAAVVLRSRAWKRCEPPSLRSTILTADGVSDAEFSFACDVQIDEKPAGCTTAADVLYVEPDELQQQSPSRSMQYGMLI